MSEVSNNQHPQKEGTEKTKKMKKNYIWPARYFGSIALLSHFDKVLVLSKFALLKCKIEVNPVAQIPWATSTAQFQFVRCWWPRESVLWGSLHFHTLKVWILKVLTLCQSAKVRQCYLSHNTQQTVTPENALSRELIKLSCLLVLGIWLIFPPTQLWL